MRYLFYLSFAPAFIYLFNLINFFLYFFISYFCCFSFFSMCTPYVHFVTSPPLFLGLFTFLDLYVRYHSTFVVYKMLYICIIMFIVTQFILKTFLFLLYLWSLPHFLLFSFILCYVVFFNSALYVFCFTFTSKCTNI